MINFEGYSRRIDKINSVLGEYGIESLEAAQQIVSDNGIDVRSIVLGIQPIAFENAVSILLLFLNTNTIIAPKMVSQIV